MNSDTTGSAGWVVPRTHCAYYTPWCIKCKYPSGIHFNCDVWFGSCSACGAWI